MLTHTTEKEKGIVDLFQLDSNVHLYICGFPVFP